MLWFFVRDSNKSRLYHWNNHQNALKLRRVSKTFLAIRKHTFQYCARFVNRWWKLKSFSPVSKLKFYANELKVINPQKYAEKEITFHFHGKRFFDILSFHINNMDMRIAKDIKQHQFPTPRARQNTFKLYPTDSSSNRINFNFIASDSEIN